MGMIEYAPDFSLSAEGKDITAAIRRGLIEIRYTDNGAGTKKADELQITLSSETLAIPSKGAVLRLALGFNGVLVDKGSFTVCQVQSSGPPRRLSIYATSAPMNPGKHGSDVTQAKTRAFDDITLADLLKTVASENGLQARVSSELASITIPYIAQTAESDAALITRIAAEYGAVSKVSGGYWMLLKFGAAKSAGGRELSSITITPDQVLTGATPRATVAPRVLEVTKRGKRVWIITTPRPAKPKHTLRRSALHRSGTRTQNRIRNLLRNLRNPRPKKCRRPGGKCQSPCHAARSC